MSQQHPEYPRFNNLFCKDIDNPKLCALVREDKTCLKKLQGARKRKKPVST